MGKINYNDKQFLYQTADIPAENKVNDVDMNEIKEVVNDNDDDFNAFKSDIDDYVTGRYNNGAGWAWTVWKSGRVELTGRVQHTGLSMTTQSAGTYYGQNNTGTKTTTLPVTLASQHLILTAEAGSRSSGVYVYNANASGNTVTTEFRAFASSTNASCGVWYYIVGYLAS